MLAELSGGTIWFKSEYRLNELMKRLPGAHWSSEHRLWHCPVSWAACVTMRGLFGDQLEIGPALTEWAMEELQTRVKPCQELREASDFNTALPELPAGLELEPLQRVGAAFMATAGQAANCDGMGSGKTIQTIVALEELAAAKKQPYPALIVCPNSMKHVWKREFGIWAPHREAVILEGGPGKEQKQLDADHDVYIVNWEKLRLRSKLAGYGYIKLSDGDKAPGALNKAAFRTFVGDEAHRGKNPKAKQTRAAWAVAHECEFRFALTGTPLANSPEDLWSIMHLISPEEYPTKTKWLDRYGLLSWNPFGGMDVVGLKADTRDELFRFLDARFIRRPTQMVIPELIAKLPPQERFVELTGKQKKAYEQMREQMLAELDEGVLMATNPLARMTRLVQLASAYGEIDDGGNMKLSDSPPSAKLDALDDILEELGDEEQVVVFAESRQLIELAAARLAKAKITHGLITGSISTADRQKYVDKFQAGELRVMLATLGAGGEGLTLTAARHAVFLQKSFSIVKNLQAEDRIWRKGQYREVQRIDIIVPNSIEDRVREIGEEKLAKLEEVCRDEATVRNWLAKL